MSRYSVVFDADSLLWYYFVEFGWIRSADIWFRCASVSTFRMFAEQVSVFCELELIVPLDITTYNGFFYADSPICYYFVEFGWIR